MSDIEKLVDELMAMQSEADILSVNFDLEKDLNKFKKSLSSLFHRYADTKKKLRILLIDIGALPVMNVIQYDALQKIVNNVPIGSLDELYIDIYGKEQPDLNLDPNEKWELAEEILLPQWSHLDYIDNMIQFKHMILKVGELPPNLNDYVRELKECFAFDRYLAVVVLCRTILEIALVDIDHQLWMQKHNIKKVHREETAEKKNLAKRIQDLTSGELNKQMHWIRERTNVCIHGKTDSKNLGALKIMEETFKAVVKLYETYDGKINK